MKIFDDNPVGRIVFMFGFAIAALLMIIFASMVEMPLRAILIAVAVSNIIFLGVVIYGSRFPGNKD